VTRPLAIQDVLETMIDAYGVQHVVQVLAVVCREKAEHSRASYDDAGLAQRWDDVAGVLDNTADRSAIARLAKIEGRQ
jgi:hypothetical protein